MERRVRVWKQSEGKWRGNFKRWEVRRGDIISAKMMVTGEPLEHYKFCQNNGILTGFFRPFRVIVPHEIWHVSRHHLQPNTSAFMHDTERIKTCKRLINESKGTGVRVILMRRLFFVVLTSSKVCDIRTWKMMSILLRYRKCDYSRQVTSSLI